MCRFLLAQANHAFDVAPLLGKFAIMAKKSQSYDGDWQGDGWGVSWFDQLNGWQTKKSISPIWECEDIFASIPKTSCLLIHARSASFPKHKGVITYNQPYVWKQYAFVFNGLLKGVSLPYQLAGTIGAQKIWSLFRKYLVKYSVDLALRHLVNELNKYTHEVQALNIGFSDGKKIYAYCQFNKYPKYYNLLVHQSRKLAIICSEELEGVRFAPMSQLEVVSISPQTSP